MDHDTYQSESNKNNACVTYGWNDLTVVGEIFADFTLVWLLSDIFFNVRFVQATIMGYIFQLLFNVSLLWKPKNTKSLSMRSPKSENARFLL